MTFTKRKMKKHWMNDEVCTCGHKSLYHSVPFFKFAGHCETCTCNAYNRDKTLARVYYMTPDLSICDRLKGLFGRQESCE